MVLKRLGATPLRRGELVTAKMLSVFAIEMLQLLVLVPLGVLLGWETGGSNAALVVPAVLLGTAAFTGIGLTLAGTLRGEVNLAAQNGLYLVLLLLGGMVIPMSSLPGTAACSGRTPALVRTCRRAARQSDRGRQPRGHVMGRAGGVGGCCTLCCRPPFPLELGRSASA